MKRLLFLLAFLLVPVLAEAQLQPGARLVLSDYLTDDEGVVIHFVSPNPGPGQASDYYLRLTDADLTGAVTDVALRALINTKLRKKFRAVGVAVKIDPLINEEFQP